MSLSTKALARGAFVALMMSSLATGALAAPKAAAMAAKDAKLQAMQQQLDALNAQMSALRNASPADPRVDALQQQLAAFAAQLADLKTIQTANESDIITLKAPPSGGTTIPSLPNGKPALASADGRFTANIRANIMFDAGKYFQKDHLAAAVTNRDLNDGTNFRRARFGADGKIFKDFDYSVIMEFGGSGAENAGSLYEAYVQYTALKPWKIRVGAFEPNIGLAAAVSTGQMPLLERPGPAEVARNVAAGDSRSAVQVFGNGTWGEGDSGIATRWFASAAFTGNTIGTINSSNTVNTAAGNTVVVGTLQPSDEQTAIIGRFAIAPFSSTDWQAHFGVNAQYVMQPNNTVINGTSTYGIQLRDRPELRLDGTRLVDTGAIDSRHATVIGGEAGLTFQNFLIESEYFQYSLDRRNTGVAQPSSPDFSGWYVQAAWVLSGEARPYNPAEGRFDGPKPNYNFNAAAGTWGAWEIAARYSDLDLNYHDPGLGKASLVETVRGGEQKVAVIGLNWYLNSDIRFMLDYSQVDVSRYNAAGVQVGQKFNTLALRSQFSF
jgi:phosphate-selective porin OprO/OprP